MTEPNIIQVRTADPYPVIIGRGLLGDLVEAVNAGNAVRTVAIFHQPPLAETAEAVRKALADTGIDAHRIEIPDAEDGKELAVAVVHRDLDGLHAEVEMERAMASQGGKAKATP